MYDPLEGWIELLDDGDLWMSFTQISEKLKAYGIKGGLLIWIENFLSGRRQSVVVNDN